MNALIKQYYDYFNKGDAEGMLSLLDDKIEHDSNQGSTHVGKEKFRSFLNHMNECYKEELKDIVIMADANGTHASAEFMVHGTYLKSDGGLPPANNQKYVIRAGTFFRIENNKIKRVTTYYNLNEWITLVSK